MNINDMSCACNCDGLTVFYDCGIAKKASVSNYSGRITFELRDGRIIEHVINDHILPNPSYLKQFGISISENGEYFFIQSWEKGLFCFHMQDGSLLWHYKTKHAYDLVVRKNHIVCLFFGLCVSVIEISSGKMVSRFPLSSYSTCFVPITDERYIVGPKRGKYLILDENLSIVSSIPIETFNPRGCTTFLLLQAYFTPDGLLISGFEHFGEDNTGNMEQNRFYRLVSL